MFKICLFVTQKRLLEIRGTVLRAGERLEQAQRAHSPELCSGVSERITNISSPIEDFPKLCFGELQFNFYPAPAERSCIALAEKSDISLITIAGVTQW